MREKRKRSVTDSSLRKHSGSDQEKVFGTDPMLHYRVKQLTKHETGSKLAATMLLIVHHTVRGSFIKTPGDSLGTRK